MGRKREKGAEDGTVPDSLREDEGSERSVTRLKHYVESQFKGGQQVLAEQAGVSAAHLSGWLAGQRALRRGDAVLLALTLLDLRVKRLKEDEAKDEKRRFDAALNDMLDAAGYSAIRGRRKNLIYQRMAEALAGTVDLDPRSPRPRLRVGWARMPGFAESITGTVRGLAIEAATQVAMLMDHEIALYQRDWGALVGAIHNREIDLIAPVFMQLPSRMFNVAFSAPLPNIRVGFNGIVRVNGAAELDRLRSVPKHLRNGVDLSEVQRSGANIPALRPVIQKGGVGETLCPLVFRGSRWDRRRDDTEAFAFAMELEPPDYVEGGVTYRRCFVADEATCLHLLRENADVHTQAHLLFAPGKSPVTLQVAFATHRDEVGLLKVLNYCVDVLGSSDLFKSQSEWYAKYQPSNCKSLEPA